MPRRKTHAPLDVLINGRRAGQLSKDASGAIGFTYDAAWLAWEHAFPVSLSLPLGKARHGGATVSAVFDNLLPDSQAVRGRVAQSMAADGADPYSLLAAIGRDCVGAMQFLPAGEAADATAVAGEPLDDEAIAAILDNLHRAPLGVDRTRNFRISVAGAQEKTALLRKDGQWLRPFGSTPTTHILKPRLGTIPTASGNVDMTNSVDNEHYCLKLMEAFGLPVAASEIATFGAHRVLAVERFDRRWTSPARLLRLPQEDCCQALGVPPSRKYEEDGGPGAIDVLKLLRGAQEPLKDQAIVFKSLVLFWMIGATDGHAKNFSIFLGPGGRYRLTPLYDVLSVQPAVDRKQLLRKDFKLAMAAGANRHDRIDQVNGRHFAETGRAAGLGPSIMADAITEILANASSAPARALSGMPADFAEYIHQSISAAVAARVPRLRLAFESL